MKVIEHFERAKNPLLSIEIIPPMRGGNVQQIIKEVEELIPYGISFIDITSHAAEALLEETSEGTIHRKIKRKRPGTIGLCAAIKARFGLDPVPHLLCAGFTREETEDVLIELHYLGIENLLAIRGDHLNYDKEISRERSINHYASDLVKQVVSMNKGIYLDTIENAAPTNFCIGVACYPEKHFEAPSLNFDIQQLKRKQENGAHYAVTQMFFENRKYKDYVAKCRAAGITFPIIPGLKILTNAKQLSAIPRNFYTDIPHELVEEFLNSDPKHHTKIGVNFAFKQSMELLEMGVPSLHFYIMQSTRSIVSVLKKLKAKM